jgi:DNA adenine methylase
MISSPLRYPGGKAKLFPFFANLITKNGLLGSHYCEPYAGGAGLALRLLTCGFVDRILINDIDKSIYAFWKVALEKSDQFCSKIERTPITIDEWHKQKSLWKKGNEKNFLELGFAAYFLNRTNRSGIISGAGPIGGYNQNGKWKIDARLIKEKQIENIKSLSKFRKEIHVSNLDAMEFFQKNARNQKSFFYLDPPYYVKGSKLYTNFYQQTDHERIAKKLEKNRKAKWVVTYDDVPEIREAYSSFSPIEYYLNYSVGKKTIGTEVMFLSDTLSSPDAQNLGVAA